MKPLLRYLLLSIAALALLTPLAGLAAEAAMSVEVPPGSIARCD
jgi:hypothetical protein